MESILGWFNRESNPQNIGEEAEEVEMHEIKTTEEEKQLLNPIKFSEKGATNGRQTIPSSSLKAREPCHKSVGCFLGICDSVSLKGRSLAL